MSLQTKTSLAVLFKSQFRFDEAQALLESAVGIREKALGPDHPAVASSLLPLSEIYRRQGRRDDAEKLFKRARAIRKSSLREVPVFFATNRKRDPDAKSVEFGTESASHLTLGTASLSILKEDGSTKLAEHSVAPKKSEDSGKHHRCDKAQHPAARRARRERSDEGSATTIAVFAGLQ